MEPKFLTVLLGALVQVYCPTIDAFCCRHHVSCSGGHESDSFTMTTGKGSSSFTPTIIYVAVPVLFCARTCHRLYIVVVHICINVLRALLFAIPRYRHDANDLTVEGLDGFPLSGPPHVIAAHGLQYSQHPSRAR